MSEISKEKSGKNSGNKWINYYDKFISGVAVLGLVFISIGCGFLLPNINSLINSTLESFFISSIFKGIGIILSIILIAIIFVMFSSYEYINNQTTDVDIKKYKKKIFKNRLIPLLIILSTTVFLQPLDGMVGTPEIIILFLIPTIIFSQWGTAAFFVPRARCYGLGDDVVNFEKQWLRIYISAAMLPMTIFLINLSKTLKLDGMWKDFVSFVVGFVGDLSLEQIQTSMIVILVFFFVLNKYRENYLKEEFLNSSDSYLDKKDCSNLNGDQ